jgi:iron(III) transport system substrate-binding protein
MVLAANRSVTDPPTAFADLAAKRFRDRVTIADPLASGTAFTWLAFQDPKLLEAMHANGVVAAGGNSAVLNRLASGERPVGVILLENVLAAPDSPVTPILPTDGAVVVPGPIALTASCPNPVAAGAVYDFILSEAGQKLIAGGHMYPALPTVDPPAGAPPLDGVEVRRWVPGFVERVTADQAAMKERWAELVAR